eukprot:2022769-Pleurochrysis_carterae.AAC.2
MAPKCVVSGLRASRSASRSVLVSRGCRSPNLAPKRRTSSRTSLAAWRGSEKAREKKRERGKARRVGGERGMGSPRNLGKVHNSRRRVQRDTCYR